MGVKRAMQGKKGDQAIGQASKQRAISERASSRGWDEAGIGISGGGKIPLEKKNQSQHINVTFRPMD